MRESESKLTLPFVECMICACKFACAHPFLTELPAIFQPCNHAIEQPRAAALKAPFTAWRARNIFCE
jgi:hypothetical protein